MDSRRIQYRIQASLNQRVLSANPPAVRETDNEVVPTRHRDYEGSWWDELSPDGRRQYLMEHPDSEHNPHREASPDALRRAAQLIPRSVHDTLNRITNGVWGSTGNSMNTMANALTSWTNKYGEFKHDHETLHHFIMFAAAMVLSAAGI